MGAWQERWVDGWYVPPEDGPNPAKRPPNRGNMPEPELLSESFNAVVELALALGVTAISKRPGLWEHVIDDTWSIAVNPHRETIEWPKTPDRMGAEIPPFHMAVCFNGWLAGLFSPHGGIFAAGAAGNEGAFLKAAQAATERARIANNAR